ncbi:hypothetical protein S7335_1084 [Synechococcus sp. PCC 7335]|uniref:DUF6788 family protein n=1 Tax=Synechococcus sp. (strain ATCC 29403 / PCC 7335) TaxID=91464 RepID=UPI00017ECF2F|nr:DUF6788 family protein [Synechococcus sp. PCC 7335]EDX82781.1 hypothetical protein S7335_1084 [Synechococcus sp. PCC 7335]
MASKRERLYKQIQRLSLEEKQALRMWLDEQIAEDEKPPKVKPKQEREVIETKQTGRVTYQLELVKCGKEKCRCVTEGELHGPYWYAYRKQGQKLKSWYIGKELKRLSE